MILPATAAAPEVTVNVAALSDAASMASLKVAFTLALMGTPAASLSGEVEMTVGVVTTRPSGNFALSAAPPPSPRGFAVESDPQPAPMERSRHAAATFDEFERNKLRRII